jgi:hypothetical protein
MAAVLGRKEDLSNINSPTAPSLSQKLYRDDGQNVQKMGEKVNPADHKNTYASGTEIDCE